MFQTKVNIMWFCSSITLQCTGLWHMYGNFVLLQIITKTNNNTAQQPTLNIAERHRCAGTLCKESNGLNSKVHTWIIPKVICKHFQMDGDAMPIYNIYILTPCTLVSITSEQRLSLAEFRPQLKLGTFRRFPSISLKIRIVLFYLHCQKELHPYNLFIQTKLNLRPNLFVTELS